MAYEHKDGRGSLFRNTDKDKDSQADYAGSCKVDGKDFWMNAWIEEKNGKKFFSISFRPKQESNQSSSGDASQDDIPF